MSRGKGTDDAIWIIDQKMWSYTLIQCRNYDKKLSYYVDHTDSTLSSLAQV